MPWRETLARAFHRAASPEKTRALGGARPDDHLRSHALEAASPEAREDHLRDTLGVMEPRPARGPEQRPWWLDRALPLPAVAAPAAPAPLEEALAEPIPLEDLGVEAPGEDASSADGGSAYSPQDEVRSPEAWARDRAEEDGRLLPLVEAPGGGGGFRTAPGGPEQLKTMALHPEYVGEERGASPAEQVDPASGRQPRLPVEYADRRLDRTYYASSREEFATSVDGGTLTRGGKVLNSADALERGAGGEILPDRVRQGAVALWEKDKAERMNFAMDADGGLYTSDPLQELLRSKDQAQNDDRRLAQRYNHSSMVGGGDVAAAGTLKVRQGRIEEMGDGSGHYKPSLPHTAQAWSTLQEQGAIDPARASLRVQGKRGGERDLLMSGHEIGAWEHELSMARVRGGEALQGPERAIRAAHAPKDAALDQIRAAGAAAGVEAEAEAGVVSTAIRPSRLRRPAR